MFEKEIDLLKENIITSTCELIKIPSVLSDSSNPSMPFGQNCNKALEYMLDLGNRLGFRTKNIDGYCGYIEFGEVNELVGIIGHLDVVPEGENWTYPPFSATISDNNIYGRGAIDDKGPVMASLYAMKVVMDTCNITKRVRLILGLNEENDWKCIEYYKKYEETPSFGFSPDADFPCIYAEKGILSVRITHPFSIKNMEILNIDCNNNALNVVPKYCSITLKNTLSGNIEKLEFNGVPAHAAHPDLGDNAITKLIEHLISNLDQSLTDPQFTFLTKMKELGFFNINNPNIKDESGILTSNIGYLGYENNNLQLGFNLRIPVNTSLDEIKSNFEKLKNTFPDINIKFTSENKPLYIPKDSNLVTTLTDIFNKKTNRELFDTINKK